MSDLFVLSMLSNGVTIGEAMYYVAWNGKRGVAVIWVSPAERVTDNDPLEELFISDLMGENGEPLEFSSELKAHAFIEGLRKENE